MKPEAVPQTPTARHGEGPRWNPLTGTLLWLDMDANTIHRLDPVTGRTESWSPGLSVGAVIARAAGGLALWTDDGLALCDTWRGRPRIVATPPVRNRANDGACDPAGRFFGGTMSGRQNAGAAHLYRVDPDGSIHPVFANLTISNGLGWNSTADTFYFVDTPTGRVDVCGYDVDTGAVGPRREFVRIPDGHPDGLALDAEDGVWVAAWDGWGVFRFTPDGTMDRVVRLPVAHVTSCAFGGESLDTLYVTSSQLGLDPDAREAQPLAGALFRCRPGVRGATTALFAG